ncbi:tRNA (adenosine(37)-N6)-threonylcarbamoyltransferase complex ATPase subunit type 1 TsaE [Ponticaulis sp.]|uniref:tRNA (adenosine(37)-N6)-threonylcarbamoyltransferase complex ATPase subunit type 1 TsaE n=1 Tax=Ponticaulis sp. TaxID=2020902 RepID=UPI000B65DAAE|nr:tRNA (adenosine(37)-N6)-threonylcarbamoyltransferase complex ATPase subunit type 1 TsaE [Ponticaulis sp.]MAI91637.1 tRNA (adenosine(37)-N6)-threonylcarbamoyltransferase complex ATPase subunit type 1 TsaE [Ponticaulis sp.]OUX97203.1 MAG: tRNA (adenosine(37)-N6)-threonylcarbamoyltransferase complex ATPase subunit type 1 TsaE [Hyphomonadaceae bacterium TMED5]|tara:strand:+ start:29375 stop:29848 length:474 start_codon:yes stop_codon:yes gene_type:complete
MQSSPDIEILLNGEAETLELGARLASLLRAGDCVALYGDLGAGKTTLSRGLIQAMDTAIEEIPSPTYTIVQTYEIEPCAVWHFDLYRIDNPMELVELGFDDALNDISLIEWPENAGSLLPENRLSVRLAFSGDVRKACLSGGTAEWIDRLNDHFRKN